jgi:hypothetical protein
VSVRPTLAVPRIVGAASVAGGDGAQPDVGVASPADANGAAPVALTWSWNAAPQPGAELIVPAKTTRAPGATPAPESGPHSISFGSPSGWPATQRAVISPTVAPPTNAVPAGPTSTNDAQGVEPPFVSTKSYVAEPDAPAAGARASAIAATEARVSARAAQDCL